MFILELIGLYAIGDFAWQKLSKVREVYSEKQDIEKKREELVVALYRNGYSVKQICQIFGRKISYARIKKLCDEDDRYWESD